MHQTGAIGTYDIFCTRIHVTFHLITSHLSGYGVFFYCKHTSKSTTLIRSFRLYHFDVFH